MGKSDADDDNDAHDDQLQGFSKGGVALSFAGEKSGDGLGVQCTTPIKRDAEAKQ
jgi:hypothetical protein